VQLILARDASQAWSKRYDRELTDIFVLQDDIALAIADALKVKLVATQRHTSRGGDGAAG
jgi:adenylate cyclase